MTTYNTSSQVSYLPQTGTTNIDALLALVKWGAGAGTGATETFSFSWTTNGTAQWYSSPSGTYANNNEPTGTLHSGFEANQMQAARAALQSWSNVANVQFQEVAETGSNVGDIRFARSSAGNPAGEWGHTYYPSNNPAGGDIWISPTLAQTDWSAGTYNYEALMHEIGHALGLKHPGNYDVAGNTVPGPFLPSSLDNRLYTVMSYSDPAHNLALVATENADGSHGWQLHTVNPETPMVLDIAAMQSLYGANTTYHAGDDVYTFSETTPFFKTIWDAGGHDTISVANFSQGCLIDLNPGHYSSIRILPAPLPANYTGPVATYDGTNNLGIAYGTIIQDAIGGAGDDTLIGNAADNVLCGGGGNNTIIGGGGCDTALYAGVRSNYTVTKTLTGFTVSGGGVGTDTLTNVDRLQLADTNVALDINGIGGEVYRLYKAAFDRVPDVGGLGYWIAQMDQGMDLIDVGARMMAGTEFKSQYGTNSTTGVFLTNVYQNVLGRNPDSAGLAWWTNEIANNPAMTTQKVLADFSESPENHANVIGTIGSGFNYTLWHG